MLSGIRWGLVNWPTIAVKMAARVFACPFMLTDWAYEQLPLLVLAESRKKWASSVASFLKVVQAVMPAEVPTVPSG
jgi:hypothetical protein